MSPAGKFTVELAGTVVGSGPRYAYPPPLWPVTVRVPVTATALAGTPPRPATWKVRGAWAVNGPLSPMPNLVSSIREGGNGTYVPSCDGRTVTWLVFVSVSVPSPSDTVMVTE